MGIFTGDFKCVMMASEAFLPSKTIKVCWETREYLA